MDNEIHVLVVDDHQVVREGLRRMLEQEEGMVLVGQGANGEEALFQAEILEPDIILMDIKMPGVDGIETTRQIIERHPACNVIMLTFYDEYLMHALEAGARGYLLKDTRREELVQAIRRVHNGEVIISEAITSKPRNGHHLRYDSSEVITSKPRNAPDLRYDGSEAITSKPRNAPDLRYDGDVIAASRQRFSPEPIEPLFEEVLLILPPPVESNLLMKFAGQVEETLSSRVLQVVGSWEEGTAVTILLNNALPLADITNKLKGMPGIKTIEEEPLPETNAKLMKKVAVRPKSDKLMRTIFITLEKEGVSLAK